MVLDSVFETFKTRPQFWKTFWKGIEAISILEERDQPNGARQFSLKTLAMNVVKSIQSRVDKGLDATPTNAHNNDDLSKFEYPKEIISSIPQIKLRCLDYLQKILRTYSQVKAIII